MFKHSTSNLGLHFEQPTTTETYKLHKETKMKRAPRKQKQNTESAQTLRREEKLKSWGDQHKGEKNQKKKQRQKLKFWEELQQQETGKKKKKRGKN